MFRRTVVVRGFKDLALPSQTGADDPDRRVMCLQLGSRSVSATLGYPRGRLRRGDRWLVCTPEPTPDAFGRPRRIDPLCGLPTLPRSS